MIIVGFLGWWYGAGWRARAQMVGARLMRIFDYFSLDLLIKTWFAPFRQIGTGQAARGFSEQVKIFFDKLVSRAIGGGIRTVMMIVGIFALIITALIGLLEIVLWLFVPLFPVVGCVLFAIGWVPYVGF